MCLIITGPAKSIVSTLLDTPTLLQDIYESNGDGVGVMYANSKRKLRVHKALPKSWQQARDWIRQLPNDDRMVAMHWRWRTHGDINLEQCHPYHVTDSLAMMHNGVLHTGNHADTKKSDTWHFIQDYLVDLVVEAPKVVHKPSMVEFIGDYIGDNRFVFMDGDGDMTIVNEDQGVKHGDLWFSNTYAWSPELLIPGYRSKSWGSVLLRPSTSSTGIKTPLLCSTWTPERVAALDGAMDDCDVDAIFDQLNRMPYTVAQYLLSQYEFEYTGSLLGSADTWLSEDERLTCEALIDCKLDTVVRLAGTNAKRMSECICYYLAFERKAPAADAALTVAYSDDDVEFVDEDGQDEDGGHEELVSYGSDGDVEYELYKEDGLYGYTVYAGAGGTAVRHSNYIEDRASAERQMRQAVKDLKEYA